MNANKTQLRTSYSKFSRRILCAAAAFVLTVNAEPCLAFVFGLQQSSTPSSGQASKSPQPEQLPNPVLSVSPSPTPAPAPPATGPGFVLPHTNDREIVVTAVGDVMLGTTFPDET